MSKYTVRGSTTNPVKIGAKIDLQPITVHGNPKDRNKKRKPKQKTTRQLLVSFIKKQESFNNEVRDVFKRNDLH